VPAPLRARQGHRDVAADGRVPASPHEVLVLVVCFWTAQGAPMRMPRSWAILTLDRMAADATDPAAQAYNVSAPQGSDGLSRPRVRDWPVIPRD
jgi:hypothetical protein